MVADDAVITAAHCLQNADFVEVTAGAHNLDVSEPEQQVRTSTDFILHENWNSFLVDNDIAMIFLDELFEPNNYVRSIDRAKLEPAVGKDVTLSGWGQTCDNGCNLSSVLMTVTCPVLDDRESAGYYGSDRDYAHIICIGSEGGHGACSGDSGAPLVNTETDELTGLYSFGPAAGCESGYPHCFTSVTFYNDWIDTNMDSRK